MPRSDDVRPPALLLLTDAAGIVLDGGPPDADLRGRPVWEGPWWSAALRPRLRDALRDAAGGPVTLDDAGHAVRVAAAGAHRVVERRPAASPEKSADPSEGLAAALERLLRIEAAAHPSYDALLRAYLEAGCELLGMEAGVVSEVHGDACTFRAAYPDLPAAAPGSTYPLATQYCEDVVAAGRTVVYADTDVDDRLRTHPAHDLLGVRAYAGTPVDFDGAHHGVLFFVAFGARPPFADRDRTLLELMAARVGRVLALRASAQARQAAQVALEDAQRIAHVGSWDLDVATGQATLSAETFRILGLPPRPSLAFATVLDLLPGPDRERLEGLARHAVETGAPVFTTYRFVRPGSAHPRTVILSSETRTDADGRVRLVGTLHDVTDVHRLAARLQQAEQRYRLLAEHTTDLVTEIGRDGVVRYASPSAADVLGYRPEALVGRAADALLHPDDRDAVRAAFASDGAPVEHRARRADGAYVWLETAGRVVTPADEPEGVVVTSSRPVGERRRAAVELQASRDLLASVLTASLDGIAVLDAVRDDEGHVVDFRYVVTNPRADAIVGRAEGTAVGRTICELYPGVAEDGLLARYVHLVETGEPLRDTFHYAHEGIDAVFDVTGVRVGDGVAFTFRDVTAERRREAALQESEARFRLLAEHATDLVSSGDMAGVTTYVSPSAERLLGYTPEEMIGRDNSHLIHPDDWRAIQANQAVQDALPPEERQTEGSLVYRVRHKAGHYLWLESSGRVVFDPETGAPTGTVLGSRDVTERVETEAALRASEERFRLLTENAWDMVSAHDLGPDTPFTYVSPAAQRILGYAPEELVGRSPYAIIHPDDVEAARTLVHDPARAGGEPAPAVFRFVRKDGTPVWIEVAARPTHDAAGRIVGLQTAKRDVTERVEATRALEATNRALELRNRELQDFAYVASHDLQEPLRKIRAFSALVATEHGAALPDEARHYLDRVEAAAGRMSRLLTDLLAYSRVTTRTRPFERVAAGPVLQDALADLDLAVAEADARLEIGPLPDLDADPAQLRQLFLNLVGNAVKFRRPGVPPVVRVCGAVEAGPEGGEAVAFEVEDNGIGFDEKYLDRIFAPFQRLHSHDVYAGTGIGLAIVRRIAERHGGTVTARAREGEGAIFRVTLPRTHLPPV